MKNTKAQGYLLTSGYCLLFAALFFLRIYKLQPAGLPDFDSVANLLIAKAIAGGNFSQLFAHASPTFNLLLALAVKFTDNFVTLEYLNSFVILTAVFLMNRFVSKYFKLLWWEELLLFSATGSSLILTYLSRGLTFEGLSLLLFVLFFRAYFKSIITFSKARLYIAALFFAVLLTVNYKALVLLPIILVIEIFQQKRRLPVKDLVICILIPAGIFVFYSALGWVLNLPWYKYLVVAGAIAFQPDDHPNRDFGFFNFDLLFYLKYFWYFENPGLLIGLFLLIFSKTLQQKIINRSFDVEIYVVIFAVCVVAGMSLVQKAPRGILYAYPLLYALTFINFRNLIREPFFLFLLWGLFISFNLFTITQSIYKYAHTSYPQLANYLTGNKISKVAATVSNQIEIYLPETAEIKIVTRNSELENLKEQGYKYLIVDDYAKITCIDLHVKYSRILKALPEPNLLSPLTALEHCEYSGLSFEEGIAISEALNAKKHQLYLVEL